MYTGVAGVLNLGCPHWPLQCGNKGKWPSGSHLRKVSNVDSFFSFLFMATPAAYGSSWARGQTGAAAAGLHHSHSNARSELCLGPSLEVTAKLDPW